MSRLARICLASGLGILGIAPALHLAPIDTALAHTYVVQPNDTLSGIAARYHVSVGYLARVNGMADPDRLQAGSAITVPDGAGYQPGDADAGYRQYRHAYQARATYSSQTPATAYQAPTNAYQAPATTYQAPATSMAATGSSYVVVPGDTLSGISSRFGVSLASLASANGIDRPDLLRVGQRLVIPGHMSGASQVSPAGHDGVAIATGTAVAAASGSAVTAGSADTLPAAPIVPAPSQAGVGALLTSEAQAYGIDPALVKAVAWQESGWRMVTAADGGIGVMQLMPATAAWVGPALLGRVIDPTNLTDNITAGVALLTSYLRQYGDVRLALAAYNAGPQSVAHGIGASTAAYIANVLSLRARFAQ